VQFDRFEKIVEINKFNLIFISMTKEFLGKDLAQGTGLSEFQKEISTLDLKSRIRLIGDIGGTWARLAVANKGGDIVAVTKLWRDDYDNIVHAVNTYKSFLGIEIDEALLAVNTVIEDNVPFFKQHDWGYKNTDFKKEFGVDKIVFFNDLQSHALSIAHLRQNDKERLQNGTAHNPEGVIVVVGPGTGLGIAYGVFDKTSRKHIFYGSEGGNQIIGAVDKEQLEVVSQLLKVRPYVRWEDACSGRGIEALYEALYGEVKKTEDIMADFYENNFKSINVFTNVCNFLGGFLHNIGKAYLPFGGIYITGGVYSNRPKNIEHLKSSRFLDYYYSEAIYGEMPEYLKKFNIDLVTHFNPGLLGLANYDVI